MEPKPSQELGPSSGTNLKSDFAVNKTDITNQTKGLLAKDFEIWPEQQAVKAPTQGKAISESIKKDAPKQTYEMPGPLGASVRKAEAQKQFTKDYAASNSDRAKNFSDKQKSNLVLSKEDVVNQTKGILGKEFGNAKSKGKDL
jgi:hypothetical protein